MKKTIDPEIVAYVRDRLKGTDIQKTLSLHDISENAPCRERELRWVISVIPEVGELGKGYFLKKTKSDWELHNYMIKSRIASLQERLDRNLKAQQDTKQEQLVIVPKNYFECRAECPDWLVRQ